MVLGEQYISTGMFFSQFRLRETGRVRRTLGRAELENNQSAVLPDKGWGDGGYDGGVLVTRLILDTDCTDYADFIHGFYFYPCFFYPCNSRNPCLYSPSKLPNDRFAILSYTHIYNLLPEPMSLS